MDTSPLRKNSVALRVQRGGRPDGVGVGLHAHRWGEIAWVAKGIQRVWTDQALWVLPSDFAAWIPGNVLHDGFQRGPGPSLWVKVAPEAGEGLPRHACAIAVSSALRDTLLHSCNGSRYSRILRRGAHDRTIGIILSSVRDCGLAALPNPFPEGMETRLSSTILPIWRVLARCPADRRSLEQWGRIVNTSSSSLARTFRREMDVPFATWQSRVRLAFGLEQLAREARVASVAAQLGYERAAKFCEMFQRNLGCPPSTYFRRPRD